MNDFPLFVFGTLLFDEILNALLGRIPRKIPAKLAGYRRVHIHRPGRTAKGPALLASEKSVVDGLLLLNLDNRESEIIDEFENSAGGYLRSQVRVRDATNKVLQAYTYLAREEIIPFLSQQEWDPADFKKNDLGYYLDQRIPEFLEKLEL